MRHTEATAQRCQFPVAEALQAEPARVEGSVAGVSGAQFEPKRADLGFKRKGTSCTSIGECQDGRTSSLATRCVVVRPQH
jgi:hypothetical protein